VVFPLESVEVVELALEVELAVSVVAVEAVWARTSAVPIRNVSHRHGPR
jgi:hypothetical protein